MEESGENWPSQLYLEESDDVNDLSYDDEGDWFCESVDGMMKDTDREQKQRELSESFLTLSATIPAGENMDRTSMLDNASKYVKQLEQRVRELEQRVECNIISSNNNNGGTSSSEVNSNGSNEITIPEVKVKVLHKDVLIIIHCEKQKGVMLKVLSLLENINLSVVNSSVLRFGNTTLDITITAQMVDGYNLSVDELVKTLTVEILTP